MERQTRIFDRVWRLTISADTIFAPGEAGWYVWLDNTVIAVGTPSSVATELTGIVYDASVLREGATIGVAYSRSYGPDDVLPEELHYASLH